MVGPYPAIITVIALLPLVIRWRQATALLFRFGKSAAGFFRAGELALIL